MDVLAGLDRVSTYTRREEVVRALRRAILTGELKAGDHLREVALAERLGVSRPTVREAMRQLIQDGLLTQEPYRGTRVVDPPSETLLEIADVRSALELLAARRAAERGAAVLHRPLTAALEELQRAAQSGDQSLMHEAHVRFHGVIYRASESELLEQIWNLIQVRTAFFLAWDQMSDPSPQRLLHDHRTLVKAILGGDPGAINHAIDQHINVAARNLVDKRRPRSASPRRERPTRTHGDELVRPAHGTTEDLTR
jgi:DNA-binding GntR family transcriptional regulator